MRLIVLLLIGLLAAGCDRQKGAGEQAAPVAAKPTKGIDRSHQLKPASTATFRDADGRDVSLADFRGKPVLVNLWASWCAPCIKELPTLERLAAERGGDLQVIAVSQDMAPQSSVTAFLADRNIGLDAYHDPDMALTAALGVQVMPTTVLYDRAGLEIWRYTGDLAWTGPEAARLLSEPLSPATAH